MLDVIALAGQAVPIAGDFLAGVTQNMAANLVCDLVTRRLRQTDEGTQAAEALQENPRGAAQRSEATRVLTTAAQADPEYAQTLSSAVYVYNQGTATSGSPHHQVNMGGGIAGKGHQVAGGNIINRKRNVRIGLGVVAAVAVLLGGVGVAQLITDDDSSGDSGTSADASGRGTGQSGDTPAEGRVKTFTVDIQSEEGQDSEGNPRVYRTRGTLTATAGSPVQAHPLCSLHASQSTSIVPVTVSYTNNNDSKWAGAETRFEAEQAMIGVHVPDGVGTYGVRAGQSCAQGFEMKYTDLGIGQTVTEDLVLVAVPSGRPTEIKLTVAQFGTDGTPFKAFSLAVNG
ncbi:hypothetical protein ACIOGX_36425 [Streptomyces sp. NPDC088147]|uniref:hypothetical protein n=1 Tax=Streptomyces sp. NPDC088147 TaxID=3365830 RepID=UPI00381E8CDD